MDKYIKNAIEKSQRDPAKIRTENLLPKSTIDPKEAEKEDPVEESECSDESDSESESGSDDESDSESYNDEEKDEDSDAEMEDAPIDKTSKSEDVIMIDDSSAPIPIDPVPVFEPPKVIPLEDSSSVVAPVTVSPPSSPEKLDRIALFETCKANNYADTVSTTTQPVNVDFNKFAVEVSNFAALPRLIQEQAEKDDINSFLCLGFPLGDEVKLSEFEKKGWKVVFGLCNFQEPFDEDVVVKTSTKQNKLQVLASEKKFATFFGIVERTSGDFIGLQTLVSTVSISVSGSNADDAEALYGLEALDDAVYFPTLEQMDLIYKIRYRTSSVFRQAFNRTPSPSPSSPPNRMIYNTEGKANKDPVWICNIPDILFFCLGNNDFKKFCPSTASLLYGSSFVPPPQQSSASPPPSQHSGKMKSPRSKASKTPEKTPEKNERNDDDDFVSPKRNQTRSRMASTDKPTKPIKSEEKEEEPVFGNNSSSLKNSSSVSSAASALLGATSSEEEPPSKKRVLSTKLKKPSKAPKRTASNDSSSSQEKTADAGTSSSVLGKRKRSDSSSDEETERVSFYDFFSKLVSKSEYKPIPEEKRRDFVENNFEDLSTNTTFINYFSNLEQPISEEQFSAFIKNKSDEEVKDARVALRLMFDVLHLHNNKRRKLHNEKLQKCQEQVDSLASSLEKAQTVSERIKEENNKTKKALEESELQRGRVEKEKEKLLSSVAEKEKETVELKKKIEMLEKENEKLSEKKQKKKKSKKKLTDDLDFD